MPHIHGWTAAQVVTFVEHLGRALPQRCLTAARLGSAAFKIAGAPHMTPYMVSTGPSFLLTASTST